MADQENTNAHHRHDIAEKLRAMGVMPGHVDPAEVESGRRSFRFVEIMLMVLVAVTLIWFIYYLNKEGSEVPAEIDDAQSAITDNTVASKEQKGNEPTNSKTAKSSKTAKQSTTSSSLQGVTVKAPAVAAQPYATRPGAIQPPWGQRPGYYSQFNPHRVGSSAKAGQVASDRQEATGEAGQNKESTKTTQLQPGYVYPYAAPPYRGYYPYPPPGYRPYAPWQRR